MKTVADLENARTYIDRLIADGELRLSEPVKAEWDSICSDIDRLDKKPLPMVTVRFTAWSKDNIDAEVWKKLKRTLAQRRYAAKKALRTVQLTHEAHEMLAEYAESRGVNLSEAVLRLIGRGRKD